MNSTSTPQLLLFGGISHFGGYCLVDPGGWMFTFFWNSAAGSWTLRFAGKEYYNVSVHCPAFLREEVDWKKRHDMVTRHNIILRDTIKGMDQTIQNMNADLEIADDVRSEGEMLVDRLRRRNKRLKKKLRVSKELQPLREARPPIGVAGLDESGSFKWPDELGGQG